MKEMQISVTEQIRLIDQQQQEWFEVKTRAEANILGLQSFLDDLGRRLIDEETNVKIQAKNP